MTTLHHAEVFIKGVQIFLGIIILIIYRHGDEGYYLGATYNYNIDAESFARGIFIGYVVYNCCSFVVSLWQLLQEQHDVLHGSFTDVLMNGVGSILWVVCGGVMLQWWIVWSPSDSFIFHNPRPVGIALSVLVTFNSVIFGIATLISYTIYNNAF